MPALVRARPAALDVVVIVGLVAAALVWRGGPLGPSSLWLDDAWVALAARVDTLGELRMLGFATPGFVVLLHVWFAAVGFGETVAQLPALAAGLAAPPALWLLLRRGLGWHPAAALSAATLLATSPIAITYATRVKPYTLETLLAVGVLALAVRVLARAGEARRWWVLAGLGLVATTVSAFAAPVVAAGAAAGLHVAWRAGDRAALRLGLAVSAAYGLASLAWYLAVLRPGIPGTLGAFWSGQFLELGDGVGAFAASLVTALTGLLEGASPLPVVATGLLVAVGAVALARRQPELAVLGVAPVAVGLVLAAAGLAPLGGGRTDSYLYPSLALLAAGAVQAVLGLVGQAGVPARRRMLGAAVAALAVVGLVATVEPAGTYPASDVRPLVAELEDRRSGGDAVIVYPATMWAYALYTPGPIHLEEEPTSTWRYAPRFADEAVRVLPPGRDDPAAYRPTVDALTAPRVWLVATHWRDDYGALQDQLRAAGYTRTELLERPGAELSRWDRG